ncbi:MAG: hypothetical protein QNJ71_05040 [Acidimicrobiia bacterium]|nr:hypothetical protein [Acidimicrobiia bacterium]
MKGRPILGVISGFLFGLLLGVTLFLFGALPLNSPWLLVLPVLGIVLGLVMAAWAPFGGGQTDEPTQDAPAQPSGTTLEQDAIPPLDEGGRTFDGPSDADPPEAGTSDDT